MRRLVCTFVVCTTRLQVFLASSLGTPHHTVQATSPHCHDKIAQCHSFDRSSICSGTYYDWAMKNCRSFCNFCDSTQPSIHTTDRGQCYDKLSNCADYGTGVCSGQYRYWAQANCIKYCGYCI